MRDGDDWVINGTKRFNTGLHSANCDMIFARTCGKPGDADGITCFIVPTDAPGFRVEFMWWTFNMPSDHAEVTLDDVRVPGERDPRRGGRRARARATRSRTRTASGRRRRASARRSTASTRASKYARERIVFGQPLWKNQAIQFPLAELQTECEMVRGAGPQDGVAARPRATTWRSATRSRCATTARTGSCCDAADRAIQVHGGIGYTRHKPFEHIYRHHRRYRITEGSEEIQIRRVAGIMFGREAKR